MKPQLPPVAPEVVAAAVEGLTARLRKKLDAAIESYTALPVGAEGMARRIRCGEDAEVTLTPGPSGVLTDAEQAVCDCLLAPRCLHRAAILSACPVAETAAVADADADADEGAGAGAEREDAAAGEEPPTAEAPPPPTRSQVTAATGLRAAAADVLAAGVPAAGAVPQAELLRAAHAARLAGLHRAEAAALRVVRGLRAARARENGHRLADLVAALR
ncbi:hypothetical protein ACWD5A_41205, partial [Streptomyces sp. NPDC002491]